MIRLIAMDLDGTLLNREHQISRRNQAALELAREKGAYIVLASGRNFFSMKQFINQINGIRMSASLNGSAIYDHELEKLVYQRPLDSEAAAKVLSYAEEMGIHTNYYHDNQIVTAVETDHSIFYTGVSGEPISGVGSLVAYNRDKSPDKLLLIGEHSILEAARQWLSLNLSGKVSHFYSNPTYLEVVHPIVSKGAALRWMAAHLEIPIEEILAFGDAENDISMIKEAGVGIAMANAPESVKSAADHITSSNDEDGVAKAIEEFLR